MSKKRRVFSAEFKAAVALEAIKEQEAINQIASRYALLPAQVSHWKAHMLKSLQATCKSGSGQKEDPDVEWEQKKKMSYRVW